MKKLLLVLLFVPIFSFSQIGEVKNVPENILVGYNNKMTKFHKLFYSITNDNQKLYTLRYRNMKYQHIDEYDSFSFTASDEEIEYLYNFFLEQMSNKAGKTIELGKNMIFAKIDVFDVNNMSKKVQKGPAAPKPICLTNKKEEGLQGLEVPRDSKAFNLHVPVWPFGPLVPLGPRGL